MEKDLQRMSSQDFEEECQNLKTTSSSLTEPCQGKKNQAESQFQDLQNLANPFIKDQKTKQESKRCCFDSIIQCECTNNFQVCGQTVIFFSCCDYLLQCIAFIVITLVSVISYVIFFNKKIIKNREEKYNTYFLHFIYIISIIQIIVLKIKNFYLYLVLYFGIFVITFLISKYQSDQYFTLLLLILVGLSIILIFRLLSFYVEGILSPAVLFLFGEIYIILSERTISKIIAFVNCLIWFFIHYFILYNMQEAFEINSIQIIYNSDYQKQFLTNLQIPLTVFLIFIWLISFYGLLIISDKNIFSGLQKVELLTLIDKAEYSKLNLVYFIRNLFSYKFSYQLFWSIISIILLISYSLIGFLLITQYFEDLQREIINIDHIMKIIYLCLAIPISLMQGNVIYNFDFSKSSLYLWTPILSTSFSILIIYIQHQLSGQRISFDLLNINFFSIAPSISSIVWLTVKQFSSDKRNLKMFLILIFTYTIFLPGIFLEYSELFEKIYSVKFLLGIFQILTLTFIAILALFIVYEILIYPIDFVVKKCEKKLTEFTYYQFVDSEGVAHWANSLFFIIMAYLLTFLIFNEQSGMTNVKKGAIFALLPIQTILFMLTNKALSLEEVQTYNWKITLSIILLQMFWFLILTTDVIIFKTMYLEFVIGIPLVLFYFKLMLSVKFAVPKYQKFTLPFFIILQQLFVIFPIGVIFPIAACLYENKSKDFANFAQFSVSYSVLTISLTIIFLVIFFQVVINKENFLKKQTQVVKSLMQTLANYRIRASQEICTTILNQYNKEKKVTVKQLKENKLVGFEELPPQLAKKFNRELVTKQLQQDYKESRSLLNKRSNSDVVQKKENQTAKCTTQLGDCCLSWFFCRIGKEEILEMKKQLRTYKIKQIELLAWKESQYIKENKNFDYYKEFQRTCSKNKFYQKLKYDENQKITFWVSVQKCYQNDISEFIEYMNLKKDDQVLKQTYQCTLNNQTIKIQLQHFVQLLKDYIADSKYDFLNDLWSLALLKYPLFISICPDLKDHLITTEGEKQNYKKFFKMKKQKENQICVYRDYLSLQEFPKLETVEKQYQIKQKQITKEQQQPNNEKLCYWKPCYCVHKCLWMTPVKLINKYLGGLSTSNFYTICGIEPLNIEEESKDQDDQIFQTIIDILEKSDKQTIISIDSNEKKKWTCSDWLEFCARVYDYLTFFIIAIEINLDLIWDLRVNFPTYFLKAIFLNIMQFEYSFLIASIVSFCYFILGVVGLNLIKNNKFNMEGGQLNSSNCMKKTLKLTLIVLGSLFLNVMKIFMDTFICDYQQYPYTFIRDPSVVCLGNKHLLFILVAIIGSTMYYFVSAFLKPLQQQYDFDLNLKYSSNYVVVYMQYQLLLVGVRSAYQFYQIQLAERIQCLVLGIFTVLLFICFAFLEKGKKYYYIELILLSLLNSCYFAMAFKWEVSGYLNTILMIGILLFQWIFFGLVQFCCFKDSRKSDQIYAEVQVIQQEQQQQQND